MDLQGIFYTLGAVYFIIAIVFLIFVSFVLISAYFKLKKQIEQFRDVKNARLVLNKFEEWAKKPKPALLPLAIFVLSFFLKRLENIFRKS